MHDLSKCPQCGNTFPYRSNKIYCSGQCKNEAFRHGATKQTDTNSATAPAGIQFTPVTGEAKIKTSDTRALLKLRRLELEHQRFMARLQTEERERDRQLEAKRLETEANHYQQLQGTVEELRKKLESQHTTVKAAAPASQTPVSKKPSGRKLSLSDNRKLCVKYTEAIRLFLDTDGQECGRENLELYYGQIVSLLKQMKHWARHQQVLAGELKPCQHLLRVSEIIEGLLDEIAQKNFWERKTALLEIEEQWREELESSIR